MSFWTTWSQRLRGQPRPRPQLSVVVITHNMRREAPRTLQSLAPEYQREVDPAAYEVLVVDNGSSEPLGRAAVTAWGRNFSYLPLARARRLPPKPSTPRSGGPRGNCSAS